jgi:hypothetical protein
MDMQRFRECAEAYGAHRRRWPARDQPLFDALAATPEGAALLAQAQRTDQFLDAWEAEGPPASLRQHITGQIGKQSTAPAQPSKHSRAWVPLGSLAASIVIGFFIGFTQGGTQDGAVEWFGQFLVDPSGMQEVVL